jgi:hypothetical protein
MRRFRRGRGRRTRSFNDQGRPISEAQWIEPAVDAGPPEAWNSKSEARTKPEGVTEK